MKLQNTRLGAYNGIEVGAVIEVKDEEVKGYLEVGFTEYVEKEEVKEEKTPVVVNASTTESKKALSDAKAQAEKIVVDAKLEAGKIVSDAKLEADQIKKDATDEAAKIVVEATTPKTEVTENKEVSGDVKDTKATTTQK